MTKDNKLDPHEKAEAIQILCGNTFQIFIELLSGCNSLIHDLHAHRYVLSKKFPTVKFDTGKCFDEDHYVELHTRDAIKEFVKESNNGKMYEGGVAKGCLTIAQYFAGLAEEINKIERNSQY